MGIETYLLIAATYGLGCFLSYGAGLRNGHINGVRMLAADVQKVMRLSNDDMLKLVSAIKGLHETKRVRS